VRTDLDERAERLASALPDHDRGVGRELLAHRILPSVIDGLPADRDPSPALGVISDTVSELLETAAPGERLAALEQLAFESELEVGHRWAFDLAVARFALARDVPEGAQRWIGPRAAQWASAADEEIDAEAARRLEALDRWKDLAEARYPAIWRARHRRWLQTKEWLGASRTGEFTRVSGRLRDFLDDAGVPRGGMETF
jgi:hypothetical protein